MAVVVMYEAVVDGKPEKLEAVFADLASAKSGAVTRSNDNPGVVVWILDEASRKVLAKYKDGYPIP
jgi:nitrate reductase NapAB chaperone NapD